MPNGKGTLDCSYCIYFSESEGYPDGYGEQRLCGFHNVLLPEASMNRICCHFEPNDTYKEHNSPLWMPLARRWAWFGIDLKPGVLYEFPYNHPPSIKEIVILREPDYQHDCWKKND